MKNDFKTVVGHRFNLRADWGVVDCQVQAVEPNKTLSYTWGSLGLESVVTWTLTSTSTGTHLRMEQSGFRPDQPQYYQGAKYGWQGFFAALEQVLARVDRSLPAQFKASQTSGKTSSACSSWSAADPRCACRRENMERCSLS